MFPYTTRPKPSESPAPHIKTDYTTAGIAIGISGLVFSILVWCLCKCARAQTKKRRVRVVYRYRSAVESMEDQPSGLINDEPLYPPPQMVHTQPNQGYTESKAGYGDPSALKMQFADPEDNPYR